MSPPGGSTATPSPNLRANGERQSEFLSPRILTREAAKVCADLDITLSPPRLRALVTRYVDEGRTDLGFLTWFISYADPTGEAAVRNVMRGRS